MSNIQLEDDHCSPILDTSEWVLVQSQEYVVDITVTMHNACSVFWRVTSFAFQFMCRELQKLIVGGTQFLLEHIHMQCAVN